MVDDRQVTAGARLPEGTPPGFPWHERLKDARALIGHELRNQPHLSWLTPENIRHFATASGDDNALWHDEEHARRSGHASVLAPPTIILAHNRGQGSSISQDGSREPPTMTDMLRLGSRWEIEWMRWLVPGDRLHSRSCVVGADLKDRRGGGKLIAVYTETLYWDQADHLVAKARGTSLRMPKHDKSAGAGYEARHHHYTPEELRSIEAAIMAETRRGNEPISADPPSVGERLGPFVKGPITEVDLAYWYGAYNPPIFGGFPLELRVRMRGSDFDVVWGEQMSAKSDSEGAPHVGMPNRWYSGPGVVTWFAHLVTSWMGDHGFLRSLDVRVTHPAVLGDTVWCEGTVAELPTAREAVIQLVGTNQLGNTVASGQAVVSWE